MNYKQKPLNKMKVTPQESEQVQKCCFDMGIYWESTDYLKHTDKPYLFIDVTLGYSDSLDFYQRHESKEITPQEFINKFSRSKSMESPFDLHDCHEGDGAPVKYPREDERVNSSTYRQKVPGGWAVKEFYEMSVSICFVPDKNNEWILED